MEEEEEEREGGEEETGVRLQLQHKTQKITGARTYEDPIKSHFVFYSFMLDYNIFF